MTIVESRISVWEALAGRAPGQPLGPADPGLWTAVAERVNPAKARPMRRPGIEESKLVSVRGVPYTMLRSPDGGKDSASAPSDGTADRIQTGGTDAGEGADARAVALGGRRRRREQVGEPRLEVEQRGNHGLCRGGTADGVAIGHTPLGHPRPHPVGAGVHDLHGLSPQRARGGLRSRTQHVDRQIHPTEPGQPVRGHAGPGAECTTRTVIRYAHTTPTATDCPGSTVTRQVARAPAPETSTSLGEVSNA